MRMKTRNWLASAFLLGLGVPALADSPIPPQEAFITPTQAEMDKAFELTVSGMAEYCLPLFSGHTVTVSQDGSLDLIADVQGNPAANCKSGPQPYETAFRIPALQAGSYPAYITLRPPCLLLSSPVPCDMPIKREYAGILTIGRKSPITYAIDPARSAEGSGFDLNLLSYQFGCATAFENLAVSVDSGAGTIVLTYLDRERPNMACPAIYKPYGPIFKMAPLKAGTYKVSAYRLPACYPCRMSGEIGDAGVLTIGPANPRKGWFLREKQVLPDKPFTLQLLNEAYGDCQTHFTNQNLVVTGGTIQTTFLPVTSHADTLCVMDARPHGPVFGMQGLKAGAYSVYVNELMECHVIEADCPVSAIPPIPSDTLIVTQTLSVLISDLRARGPKADLRGSRAAVTLPAGGTGIWRAELLNAAGRRMSTGSVRATGGARAEIDFGTAPERGVYLMRLTGPDGKTHMAPIVRKD